MWAPAEAEARLIWAEAKTPRIRCFVKTLWLTGQRTSEVLRRSHVHDFGQVFGQMVSPGVNELYG